MSKNQMDYKVEIETLHLLLNKEKEEYKRLLLNKEKEDYKRREEELISLIESKGLEINKFIKSLNIVIILLCVIIITISCFYQIYN